MKKRHVSLAEPFQINYAATPLQEVEHNPHLVGADYAQWLPSKEYRVEAGRRNVEVETPDRRYLSQVIKGSINHSDVMLIAHILDMMW